MFSKVPSSRGSEGTRLRGRRKLSRANGNSSSSDIHNLDVFGYVVIENTLTEEETGRLLEAMQRLKADLVAAGPDACVRGCRLGVHR